MMMDAIAPLQMDTEMDGTRRIVIPIRSIYTRVHRLIGTLISIAKFEINVDCDVHNCINDVVLMSISNNDDSDALCLVSVSVDDRVSVDISMNVIFCTQLVDIFVDYNTSVSAAKTPAFQLPGSECYNIEVQCCIEQEYGLPKKTLFSIDRFGGNYKYSWASASDGTLSTTQATSYSTPTDV
eukprot:996502_1